MANAKQKLKEKSDSLKKTEMNYKKDEAVCETIKKSLSKLEVVCLLFVLLSPFCTICCSLYVVIILQVKLVQIW